MQSKSDLRVYAKKLRQSLNIEAISERIIDMLFCKDFYKSAKKIALYFPAGSELNIKKIFLDENKQFFLPRVIDDNSMVFCPYKFGDNLKKNQYHIAEPMTLQYLHNDFDIMILPALMADKNGFRLGYGKGYYDRFLNETNFRGIKIILIPDELCIETLPVDKYDISADYIITQTKIIKV